MHIYLKYKQYVFTLILIVIFCKIKSQVYSGTNTPLNLKKLFIDYMINIFSQSEASSVIIIIFSHTILNHILK